MKKNCAYWIFLSKIILQKTVDATMNRLDVVATTPTSPMTKKAGVKI